MEYFRFSSAFRDEGLLRKKFKAASLAETKTLAKMSAPFARALFELANKDQKFIMGLSSYDSGDGKTQFLEELIPNCDGKTQFLEELIPNSFDAVAFEELEAGNLFQDQSGKRLLQYDQRQAKSVEIVKAATKPFLPPEQAALLCETSDLDVLKQESEILIAEWPEFDLKYRWLSMLLNFEKRPNEDREIDFHYTGKIDAMPEFQQFLDDTSQAGLLLSRE